MGGRENKIYIDIGIDVGIQSAAAQKMPHNTTTPSVNRKRVSQESGITNPVDGAAAPHCR